MVISSGPRSVALAAAIRPRSGAWVGPRLPSGLPVPGRGVHGLQRRVGKVGLGVLRFYYPVPRLHGAGKTAFTALGLSGIVISCGAIGIKHIVRGQRHGIRKIPVYLERVLGLPGSPVLICDHGNAALDLEYVKHTRHCPDLISVEVPNPASATRGP